MPQLDHVSYFSQFFWVSLLFLAFYIILVSSLLPRVATILKVRNNMIIGSSASDSSKEENVASNSSYDAVLTKGLKETQNLLSGLNSKTSSWAHESTSSLNHSAFGDSHTKYVESLANVLSKKYLIQMLLNK